MVTCKLISICFDYCFSQQLQASTSLGRRLAAPFSRQCRQMASLPGFRRYFLHIKCVSFPFESSPYTRYRQTHEYVCGRFRFSLPSTTGGDPGKVPETCSNIWGPRENLDRYSMSAGALKIRLTDPDRSRQITQRSFIFQPAPNLPPPDLVTKRPCHFGFC